MEGIMPLADVLLHYTSGVGIPHYLSMHYRCTIDVLVMIYVAMVLKCGGWKRCQC